MSKDTFEYSKTGPKQNENIPIVPRHGQGATERLQNALRALGRAPRERLTRRYDGLCRHLRIDPVSANADQRRDPMLRGHPVVESDAVVSVAEACADRALELDQIGASPSRFVSSIAPEIADRRRKRDPLDCRLIALSEKHNIQGLGVPVAPMSAKT